MADTSFIKWTKFSNIYSPNSKMSELSKHWQKKYMTIITGHFLTNF